MLFNKKVRSIGLYLLTAGVAALVSGTIVTAGADTGASAEPGEGSGTNRALYFDPFTLETLSPAVASVTDGSSPAEKSATNARGLVPVNDYLSATDYYTTLKGPNPRIPQRPEWRSPMRPGW